MSEIVLDLANYPGCEWGRARVPLWSTAVRTAVSGREYRASNWSAPKWRYKISFEMLRSRDALPEMQAIAGLFNQLRGSYDTFLYRDADDHAADTQQFGVGNGTNTYFQLLREFGGYAEPVHSPIISSMVIFAGAVALPGTAWAVSPTGGVTFVTPPASGVVLRWSGDFRWRVRFVKDDLDFVQFMRHFWSLKSVEFITVKP
jgi:uncharacterized protein (TIGR02217 family)